MPETYIKSPSLPDTISTSAYPETSKKRRNYRGNGEKGRRKPALMKEPKFQGYTEELKDHAYDLN